MATIQFYPDELDYVNATTRFAGESKSFLVTFCQACLRADAQNYEFIRPALLILMDKYKAPPEALAQERRDRLPAAPESG